MTGHVSSAIGSTDLAGFTGARVLITGGLGFIGSRLAMALVDAGARVTVVDALADGSGGACFNVATVLWRIDLRVADIRDQREMYALVGGQDYVFHLAAQTSHVESMHDPLADLDVNCRATVSMLEACRATNERVKIVVASTRQVYGRPDALPVGEDHPVRPVDVNGINKLAAEMYCALYHRVYGTRVSTLRLTNTFGPRMRVADARQSFIGAWIRAVVEGQPFEVWGGDQRRDLTYVDDAVAACCAAALSPASDGEVMNVGGEAVSLRALAELLVEVNGEGSYQLTPFPPDRAAIDIGDYVAADRKLRALLGWEPRTSLRDGLVETLNYYRENLGQYV